MQFTRDNILGTQVLLECVRVYCMGDLRRLKMFIHVSTDEVLGPTYPPTSPLNPLNTNNNNPTNDMDMNDMDMNNDNTDCYYNPTTPYASSKASSELTCKSYASSFHIPLIITRTYNIYGPFQYGDKVVPLFIERLVGGERCQVHGGGGSKRRFVYVDDVVGAYDVLIHSFHSSDSSDSIIKSVNNSNSNSDSNGMVWNITTQERSYSALEVAHLITSLMPSYTTTTSTSKPTTTSSKNTNCSNNDINNGGEWIEHIQDRQCNDAEYYLHPDPRLKARGWLAHTSFKDGLMKTIEHYITIHKNNNNNNCINNSE